MSAVQYASALGLLLAAFLSTVLGTRLYRSFATQRGIVANPNFRSLHQRPIPRGGGAVVAAVCITAIAGLWLAGAVPPNLALAIIGGGTVATIVGFIDDARGLRPGWKLLAQGILAAWILWCFDLRPLVHIPQSPVSVDLAVSWFGLVWLMNLYNFIDGIDALAATGAIFASVASGLLVVVSRPADLGLGLSLGLVAVCSLGFLVFNWPPASIFMGDAGSLFLGFTFGALIAKTLLDGHISLWTWLIIFGYFLGDTTTTTIVRMFITRKWYGEHRSHAYQNLARIWGSHLRVVLGVLLYHVLWLLPLAFWSSLMPISAPLAALLALLPVVIWTLRYGPIQSSA
jgi:Fuc2NAc and GlcNAc transferase